MSDAQIDGASALPTGLPMNGAASVSAVPVGIPSAGDLIAFAGWLGPQECDCGEVYPLYGVAPHECYWRKGPEFTLGQSTLLPIEQWTDLFVPDLEDGETWADFGYPSACGVFYCAKCQHERYSAAWAKLVAGIGEPPAEFSAQVGETRRAETHSGSVHEHAVGETDAPQTTPETRT